MANELVGKSVERERRTRPPTTEPAWQAHWWLVAQASSLLGGVGRTWVAQEQAPEAAAPFTSDADASRAVARGGG